MSDGLWPEEKITGALEASVMKYVKEEDAHTVLLAMKGDYEGELAAKADLLDQAATQIGSLSGAVRDLDTQVSTLTAEKQSLITQIRDLSPDVRVTVKPNVLLTSQFETGFGNVNNKDLLYANATAKARGMSHLAKAMNWYQVHLVGWGVGDLWQWDGTGLRPVGPTNWGSLDAFVKMGVDMGCRISFSVQLIPWHLRGKWNGDGSTTLCTYANQFDDDGILLASEVANYRLMINAVATRYMNVVDEWVTGCEIHGGYRGRVKDSSGQYGFSDWRWDAFPGTAGPNADMGLAYIHNITVEEVLKAAANYKDATGKAAPRDPATLTIVNNYPPIPMEGKPTNNSVPPGHPLRGKPWGIPWKQPFNFLQKMIPLLNRVDIVGFDMATINKDGVVLVKDDFANLDRINDLVDYITTLVPGKPLTIQETYDKSQYPTTPGDFQKPAAIRAAAFRRMLLKGVRKAYIWGTSGEAMGIPGQGTIKEAGLLTDTSTASGGLPTPMLDTVRYYHDYFGPGTPIYDVEVSGSGVEAVASDKTLLLIGTGTEEQKVAVGRDVIMLPVNGVRPILL